MELIHLSDIHIGRSRNETTRCKKIVAHIAKYHQGVPVVITGDITDSGTSAQMRSAMNILDRLNETNTVCIVPGNHDFACKGNIAISDSPARWEKYLGRYDVNCHLCYDHDDFVIIGVNSGDPTDEVMSARGYVDEEQIDYLTDLLHRFKAYTKKVVCFHHHLFTRGFFTRLEGAKLLTDALSGNCDIVLFGHDHHCGVWRNYKDIPLIVASHRSTEPISGDCLAIGMINCETFQYRLELI